MNERIKAVRLALGISQEEFGKRLGVTRGAITNIELNKVEPKPLFVDLICREFNVNEDWLKTVSYTHLIRHKDSDRHPLLELAYNLFPVCIVWCCDEHIAELGDKLRAGS